MEQDLFVGIDAQIAACRARRAAAERFSEDFWGADDALMWWRGVRDEARRTGHVGPEAEALLAVRNEPAPILTMVPAAAEGEPEPAAVA